MSDDLDVRIARVVLAADACTRDGLPAAWSDGLWDKLCSACEAMSDAELASLRDLHSTRDDIFPRMRPTDRISTREDVA